MADALPVPRLLGSRVIGAAVVAAAVVASVAFARRFRPTRRSRVALAGANTVLAVFGVLAFFSLASFAGASYGADPGFAQVMDSSGLRMDGREITNIYPFDAEGRPLRDVYLVDQAGNPVIATQYGGIYDQYGQYGNQELRVRPDHDPAGEPILHRYPQRQTVVDFDTGTERPVPAPAFVPPVVVPRGGTDPGQAPAPTTAPPTTSGGPTTSAPPSTSPTSTAPGTTGAPTTSRR